MVTPNEVETPSSDVSSPATTESLPASGDEPLIPDNFVEGVGVVEPETETETVATGDEVSSDESSADSIESTESTEIAAETTETPESTSDEVEATDSEDSAPRTYSQEERNKQEAAYQRQFAAQEKRVEDMQAQMTQMQENYQNQLVDAEVRAYTSALQTQYIDEGMNENQAQTRAQRELAAAKADWQTQQENQRLRQQVNQTKEQSEVTSRNIAVERLMLEHKVPEVHRELLQGYTDPTLMVRAAETFGETERLRQENIKAKRREVPAGGEANTFDAGSGAAGGQSERDWIENVWNEGKATGPEALARALKYQASMGG